MNKIQMKFYNMVSDIVNHFRPYTRCWAFHDAFGNTLYSVHRDGNEEIFARAGQTYAEIQEMNKYIAEHPELKMLDPELLAEAWSDNQ